MVILHYFDLATGELVETKRFADPAKFIDKEERNNSCHSTSLPCPTGATTFGSTR